MSGVSIKSDLPPPMSNEAKENQLIALAMDIAEEQMRNGTASSQVITHYLKLGSTKERMAMRTQLLQNDLTLAKTKSIESNDRMGEMYEEAMRAFRRYSGQTDDEEDV